jgi:hypothetical protein
MSLFIPGEVFCVCVCVYIINPEFYLHVYVGYSKHQLFEKFGIRCDMGTCHRSLSTHSLYSKIVLTL